MAGKIYILHLQVKSTNGRVERSLLFVRYCKALEHFVYTDSVSMLLTSANVRSVSPSGSRKTEVCVLASHIRLPIGSHCFDLAQGQKRGWWTKTDNGQKNKSSVSCPASPVPGV